MIILLAPEKIICSTTKEEWSVFKDLEIVLFTSRSDHYVNFLKNWEGLIFKSIEFFDDYAFNDTVELKLIEYAKRNTISNIIPMTEVDILRVAHVKEKLNIDGMGVDQALLFRDKIAMKELAFKHQVSMPKFKRIKNTVDLINFIDEVDYPIIIKPILGRGSLNTLFVDHQDRLHQLLSKGLISNTSRYPDLLAEQYLDAQIYHIDGVQINNQIKVMSVSKYINNCLSFVNGSFLGSYTLSINNALRNDLAKFSNHLLMNVFHLNENALFHIEVFVDQSNNIYLCEIACRMGGNGINDEVKLQQGIDIKMAFIKAECGIQSDFTLSSTDCYPVAARLLIPPQDGTLLSAPKACEFDDVIRYQLRGKTGKKFNKMTMSNDEIANFLIRCSNEKDACEKIAHLADWFNKNTIWDYQD